MRNIQSPLYYHSALPSGVLQIEDALLREPRLLTPWQKPLGPVKVDYDNPLSKGIVSCCILPQGLTYGSYGDFVGGIDLVTGNHLRYVDPANSRIRYYDAVGPFGPEVNCVRPDDELTNELLAVANEHTFVKGVTMAAIAKAVDAPQQWQTLLSLSFTNNGSRTLMFYVPEHLTDMQMYLFDSLGQTFNVETPNNTVVYDEYCIYMVSAPAIAADGPTYFYRNGYEEGTPTSQDDHDHTITDVVIGNNRVWPKEIFSGDIVATWVWDSYQFWQGGGASEFARDPFQMLMPA